MLRRNIRLAICTRRPPRPEFSASPNNTGQVSVAADKDEPCSRTQNSTDTFTTQFVRKEIRRMAVLVTLEVLQLRIGNLVNLPGR